VAVIATYLAFFPIAVNGIRGLQSPDSEAVELMQSYAAKPRQEMVRLRLPASMPYLFPAFKLAATGGLHSAGVGASPDEVDLDRDVELAHEVGKEYERSDQDAGEAGWCPGGSPKSPRQLEKRLRQSPPR
jgi:hypothetical protein